MNQNVDDDNTIHNEIADQMLVLDWTVEEIMNFTDEQINNLHPIDKSVFLGLHGRTDEAQEILLNYPDQNDPAIRFNRGWYDLFNGKLSQGLRGLDVGRFIEAFGSPGLPGNIWKDEPLYRKTILFNCEGGLGDQIVFFRFAKDFVARGANVIVACTHEVARLFNRCGFVTVSNDKETLSKVYYDYWVPSMSVAHVLGYEYETLPGAPYLDVGKTTLPARANTLKVGLRWSGSPSFQHESFRKFPRKKMHDLLSVEGATFYSLQKETDLVDNLPLIDLQDDMTTFYETAMLIKDMDLVITSCTSIAHCAGALGVPTWVIVPILPYYMWALQGDKSPWYDSVTLYRQTKLGDWTDPFDRVENDLVNMIQSKN